MPIITFALEMITRCRKRMEEIAIDRFVRIQIIEEESGQTWDIPIPWSDQTSEVLTMRNIEKFIYGQSDFPYTQYIFRGIPFYLVVQSKTTKGEVINRVISSKLLMEYSSVIVFPLMSYRAIYREIDSRKYAQVCLKKIDNSTLDITDLVNTFRICPFGQFQDIKFLPLLKANCSEEIKSLQIIDLETLDEKEITCLDEFTLGELFSDPNLSSSGDDP